MPPPPTTSEALALLSGGSLQRVLAARVTATPGGAYHHWDDLRRRKPPGDLSPEEWWAGVKLARSAQLRALPLVDEDGEPFVYAVPDQVMEWLHFIDKHAAGEVAMPEVVVGDAAARRTYLVNSLMEEAIRSSQLEGANTTRRVAKEMLRTGRDPRTRGERMIANNLRGLEFIREELGDRLTPHGVLQLHEVLTAGTLDNPDAAGRLQRIDEVRVHVGTMEGEIVHRPPPAEQLEWRLDRMCAFANGEVAAGGFMHPVVRAVLLHFWLAYDHPFEDGNGRTARALFYWAMRRDGYWLTEYLSISRILRMAPAQYGRAFVHTETDERDTTYFLLHQLRVICRAIDDLHDYLARKVAEIRDVERQVGAGGDFNHRQLALLRHALRQPDAVYTFLSHARSHRVTHQTARNDLLALQRLGLLVRSKRGRVYTFSPTDDLGARLSKSKSLTS